LLNLLFRFYIKFVVKPKK